MDIAVWVAVIGGLFSLLVVFVTKLFETRSGNIAVLAEVRRLLKVIERHKAWWERCVSTGDTDIPLVPFTTPIFDEQLKSIGTVDRKVVAKVVAFYGYVKFINAVQDEKVNYSTANSDSAFCKLYSTVLTNVLNEYTSAFDQAFAKFGLTE